jgi:hypothetical protein
MALACGSRDTAVPFVPNGWNIGYWPFRVDYSHAGLVAKRIGWRSPRLICGKRVPFALLTRADQGGTHPGLAGECQGHPTADKRFPRRRVDQTRPGLLFPCFTRLSICSMCIYMRTGIQPTRHHACIGETRSWDGTSLRSASYGLFFKRWDTYFKRWSFALTDGALH